MGRWNSSVTRVRPVFDQLLARDATGMSWLPKILECAGRNSVYATSLVPKLQPLDEVTRKKPYEGEAYPPAAFLRWLIENPGSMRWPMEKGERKQSRNAVVQQFRERLFGLHGDEAQRAAVQQGLNELERLGPRGSIQKAWAFEGITKIDCRLQTPNLFLSVEGKRRDVLSSRTEWFPSRNQFFRNLEAGREAAGNRDYAYLLVVEDDRAVVDPSRMDSASSLPHLTAQARAELLSKFIGTLTWRGLCEATGIDWSTLPDTVDDIESRKG
jgi:hypothetical protein